jgi:CelD/BcsL family acetyltransferase involved in cellulose biosynthesis
MGTNLERRSRQRLRNRLHRIGRSYVVDVGEGGREDLEKLFELNVERFGERSSFNIDQRRNVFRSFLGRFDTDLFCIYLDAEARAVSMGIVYNGTYTTLSIGYDLRVRDLSKYLVVAQIKRALALGCTKFDAGKGDNGWKSHFNLKKIPQYNLVLNYHD